MKPSTNSCRSTQGLTRTGTLLVIVLSSLVQSGLSQEVNTIGFPANGIFHGSGFDSVQLNTGDLHIEIPIWSAKGRGLGTGYKYVYDNKGWYLSTHCDRLGICTDTVRRANYNHQILAAVPLLGFSSTARTVLQPCSNSGNLLTYSSRFVHEANGTAHHLVPDPASAGGTTCWGDVNAPAYTDDGSGFVLNSSSNTLSSKDGTTLSTAVTNCPPPGGSDSFLTDSNGNQVKQRPCDTFGTDTLARAFYPTSYYDTSGTLQNVQVTATTSVAIHTGLCGFSVADYCNEYSGTWTVPQVITFPNGMTYTFTYVQNQYGEPSSVTLPTGGQISWTWSTAPGEDGRSCVSRTETTGGQSNTWNYAFPANMTDPAGNQIRFTTSTLKPSLKDWYWTSIANLGSPYVVKAEYFQGAITSNQLLKTVDTTYTTTGGVLPIRETTTWNQQNLVTKTETDWDGISTWSGTISFRNPVQKREYAYGTASPGPLVRKVQFNYKHLTTPAYLTKNILDKPTSKIVYDGLGAPKAQTTYTYDGTAFTSTSATPAPNHDYTNFGSSYTIRGDLTQVSRWLDTTGTWLSTNNTYDDLGNMRTSQDPGLHTTTYDYTDSWGDAASCTVGANTFAFATTITDPLSHRTKKSYFRCPGLLQSIKDENDIVATRAGTTLTYELMNRLSQTNRPDGGQTSYCYSDVPGSSCYNGTPPLTRTKTDKVTASLNLVETTVMDGLGRVQQTQLHDPDCGGGTGLVKVDYVYGYTPATNSSFTQVSTPHCNNPDATYGLLMTTNSDALDRVKSVVQTDGSTVTTAYGGTSVGLTTTVTDEAGKQRKSQTDALGRLTAVWEDPSGGNYQTDYGYNTLDDLTSVTQRGGDGNSANWRNRTFFYDSLSRLTSAVNPESGTIAYTYDADSNVQTKMAPIPNKIPGDTSSPQTLTTTFFYDQVHRQYKKTYTDTTPTVTYGYDGIAGLSGCTPAFSPTEAVGRRTSMCDAAGLATWDYFVMGHTKKEQRTIGTLTKSTNYTYNYDGSLATLNYPSGRTVTYTPNSSGSYTAARPLQAIDTANSFNYVKSASYKPDGALGGMINGYTPTFAGITTSNSYNKRLQPITLSASAPSQTVFSLSYDFHVGAGDNGNVFQVVNNRDTTRTVNYTYDALNRITSGFTTSNRWGDNYVIDGWGNLYQKNAYAGKLVYDPLTQIVSTKNQFVGMCYDKAGNLLGQTGACPASPPYTGAYTYDAENRLSTAAGVTYTYDGDGKRVKKSNGPLYWTGMGSDALDETDLAGSVLREYIYFNGKRVARLTSPSTVRYFFSDHLGSHDIVTNSTGGTIQEESDYGPYGEERVITDTLSESHKFTGKERDAESGLDYFGARHYASSIGRWMVPDWAAKPAAVPYAVFGNPQSLNLYSYVGNNPLAHADPDGHCWPAASCYQALANALNNFAAKVQSGSVNSSPALAALKTFGAGVLADTIKMAASPLTMGAATGACMGGNGCSVGKTALAVGGDVLKGVAIAAPMAGALSRTGSAAEEALNSAVAGASSKTATMVGAFDTQTGAVAVGQSGPLSRLGEINPQLSEAAEQVGGVGAVNPGASPVGCCAEFDAANQLTNQGSSLGDIQFTDAIRPRTGEVVPKCPNCDVMFPDK